MAMLFQFVGPAFLSVTTQWDSVSNEKTIDIQHSSIVFPVLLKDKDETENNETTSHPAFAVLIDLSSHGVNLAAAYAGQHSRAFEKPGEVHPLFQIFCAFLI